MGLLKEIIQKNSSIYFIASIGIAIKKSKIIAIDGSKRKYPTVLQLPITYKCNSKCIMCNIWRMDETDEMSPIEFGSYLKDPIFKNIKSIGISGGEPSLLNNLIDYVRQIKDLPKLKNLYLITNGFEKDALLKSLEEICGFCRKQSIYFHVSISLDGIGQVHDAVRGVENGFLRTVSTIDAIKESKNKYCDNFDLACTIVDKNVLYLNEIEAFVKKNKYNIKYRLAVQNRRLGNQDRRKTFDITDGQYRQNVKEFFYGLFIKEKDLMEKFKYFSIFYFLNSQFQKRLLGCSWKDDGITMDSKGNIFYCAVESRKIGSLNELKGEKIFFSDANIEYRKNIVKTHCEKCIHDYTGKPELLNLMVFLKYYLSEKLSMILYKYRCRFGFK